MNGIDFFNEAVSNYITFALGLILGLIAWAVREWWQRRHPSVVRVERVSDASLLEVAPEAKERLRVIYQNREVDELHQSTFEIRNTGQIIIDNIDLTLVIESEADGIDPVIEDPLKNSRKAKWAMQKNYEAKDDQQGIQITIPFLNPYKDHKDAVTVGVYSPKQLNVKRIDGGGRGWSTVYFDRVSYNRFVQRTALELGTSVLAKVPLVGPLFEMVSLSAMLTWSEISRQTTSTDDG